MSNTRLLLLAIAATGGMTLMGTGPSHAYGMGRYCAVVEVGTGSVREICEFNDFESCRLEVVSGNRGFCRDNSYWVGQRESGTVPRKRVRRHR